MSGKGDDEMERLASRLALLVSDTGEADNAGRAAGALARRLGMSGGDLKAIFLAGASANVASGGKTRADADDVAALGRQLSALRHSLSLSEVSARNAERERDALRQENEALKASLDRRATTGQVSRIVGTTLIVAAIVGIAFTFIGPAFRSPPAPEYAKAEPAGTPFARVAIVRAGGARLYAMPNRGAAIITSMPPGTHLTVKRMVVNVLTQWGEVQFAGRDGYVATTDVDMP